MLQIHLRPLDFVRFDQGPQLQVRNEHAHVFRIYGSEYFGFMTVGCEATRIGKALNLKHFTCNYSLILISCHKHVIACIY
jgi:hypothetical protein